MKINAKALMFAIATVVITPSLTLADNPLSQPELLTLTKIALDDYTTNNPEHSKHVSGFTTTTVKEDAKVKLLINHEGMPMLANYFCVRQETTFVCTAQ